MRHSLLDSYSLPRLWGQKPERAAVQQIRDCMMCLWQCIAALATYQRNLNSTVTSDSHSKAVCLRQQAGIATALPHR